MDFVLCKIALGGDPGHVLYRGPDRPVSWPEVRVLQFLHGENNVFDCEFVRSEPVTGQAEKMRLLGLYGSEADNMVYPGQRPMMDQEFPGDREPQTTQKRPERKLIADIVPTPPEPEAIDLPAMPARAEA